MNLICTGLVLRGECAGNLGEKAAKHRGVAVSIGEAARPRVFCIGDVAVSIGEAEAQAYGGTLMDSHGLKQRFPLKKLPAHDLVTSESLGIFLPVVLKSWKTSVVTCWQRCQLKSGPS